MSRVDDERQAQRLAEKLALQKRQDEERAKEKQQEASAFARLVKGSQDERASGQARQSVFRAAFAKAKEEAKASQEHASTSELEQAEDSLLGQHRQSSRADAKARAQLLQKSADEQVAVAGRERDEQGVWASAQDAAAEGMATQGRSGDAAAARSGAQGRRQDQEQGSEGLLERGKSALGSGKKAGRGGVAGGARDDELPVRGEGDRGGSGGKGGKQDGADAQPGFRLNPALLAPAPLAVPKDTQGSTRLRALANEIAQKIVERVRVGQNAAGKAEFQIDLRSTVLKGLSIKVSGGNGRISAVFSGSDRDVMKLLRDQEQSLRGALFARGLTLAEFRIEERP